MLRQPDVFENPGRTKRDCPDICKDYDKDYVYFLSTSKKQLPNISEELKVFDKIKIKEYYEGRIQHGIQWFTFEELEVQTRSIKPEVKGLEPIPESQKRELEKPTEPVIAVQKTESIEECHKNIGWLASPKNDFYLVGEIIAVTKTGYLILFRGSKKFKEPVEIDRELVEVYRKGD